MTEIEIGRAKRARRAYSFDDVAIVPSRRTRDPEEVSVDWQIDAYRFELPVLAAPMDSVMSPATAIALGRYGGLGVLNLEGLWTRYDDPSGLLEEVAGLSGHDATRRGEAEKALANDHFQRGVESNRGEQQQRDRDDPPHRPTSGAQPGPLRCRLCGARERQRWRSARMAVGVRE